MCDNKRHYLNDIMPTKKNLHKSKRPAWFEKFIKQKNKPEPLGCGGYKIIYPYGDFAISIEKGERELPEVIERLKEVPDEFQKHLIYPLEQFVTKGHTVAMLNKCPGGDLFKMMFETYDWKKLDATHFKGLAATLLELHKLDIVVLDIKPANIMWCTCDCLAFIDLDGALSLKNGLPVGRVNMTKWWNPIVHIAKDHRHAAAYKIADWCAFALVMIAYFGEWFAGWFKGETRNFLSNKFYESNKEESNDWSYRKLRFARKDLVKITEYLRKNWPRKGAMLPDVLELAITLVTNLFDKRVTRRGTEKTVQILPYIDLKTTSKTLDNFLSALKLDDPTAATMITGVKKKRYMKLRL